MRISLDFPESAFSSLRQPPAEFATSMRIAACVKWYELGKVSQAKAAELAGLSRAAFIDALREYRVPAIQVTPSGLAAELKRLHRESALAESMEAFRAKL